QLFVRELSLQYERDEDLLLKEARERAGLHLPAAVADADGREHDEALRAALRHGLEDVARPHRAKVRRRLAEAGARAWSDRAENGLLLGHDAVDRGGAEQVAGEDVEALLLVEAGGGGVSHEGRDVVAALERAGDDFAAGGAGGAEDDDFHE